jgi:hypothetical protein
MPIIRCKPCLRTGVNYVPGLYKGGLGGMFTPITASARAPSLENPEEGKLSFWQGFGFLNGRGGPTRRDSR